MSSDAVRGHPDLLVLAVLADQHLYRYGLIDELRTRSRGEFNLPEGTVYPALYRFERSQCLISERVIGPSGHRQRLSTHTSRATDTARGARPLDRLKATVA